MAYGADSTLVLHPEGMSDITFDLTGAESRTGGYVVSLGTLRLNEERRLEIAYSEGPNVEGGEAISSSYPLVPAAFQVTVYGATQAAMIQYVGTLMAAVTNAEGGTLEYKPDGLTAGVRSTFYRYEQSPPPKPLERWDRGPHDSGLYRMKVEVELQTQPYAVSDPDSPVSVLSATTIYNQDDGVAGYVTVPAASVKGTGETLTQLRVRNLESGTWAAIQKLWLARRTEGTLSNFSPILEGGTPDTDSSIHWSTESDTTRRSDNFQRYAPPEAANDQWASLYYNISNLADHEGKSAVAVVCRSLAESREDWDLKAALQVADVIVETGVKNVATVGAWNVCILGELDIPPTPISADEAYSVKLYLYLRRNSGDENNPIDIDFVDLLYVDEYPQQVTVTDGFTDSYRLFMENFYQELCHVVDQSTLALEKVAEPLCPLLKLRPGVDNRVDFIWERIIGAFEDDFEDYEAWWWMPIQDCDDKNEWGSNGTLNTDSTYYVEGDSGLKLSGTGGMISASYTPSEPWDFTVEGRFGDDDFVYVALYTTEQVDDVRIHFFTGSDYYYKSFGNINGRYFGLAKKSTFSASGSPDWSDIDGIGVSFQETGASVDLYFDDIRLVRADPDDAAKGNDTGTIWDFMRDVWHIEEQASTDHALGCLDIEVGLEQVALIHEQPPADIKYLASVRAKRDNGLVGLVFRCADGTSDSEDMAAFYIETSGDKLELRKWAAGVKSAIAPAVDQTTLQNVDYWLGVWMIGDQCRCYFGATKAAIWDDENKEFLASARVFNVTDSVFASGGALEGGQAGVLSQDTLARFDDVELYGLAGHVPGDTVQVSAKAIYRTIYPFRE